VRPTDPMMASRAAVLNAHARVVSGVVRSAASRYIAAMPPPASSAMPPKNPTAIASGAPHSGPELAG